MNLKLLGHLAHDIFLDFGSTCHMIFIIILILNLLLNSLIIGETLPSLTKLSLHPSTVECVLTSEHHPGHVWEGEDP